VFDRSILRNPVERRQILGAVGLRMCVVAGRPANRANEFAELRARDRVGLGVAKSVAHVNGFAFAVALAEGASFPLIFVPLGKQMRLGRSRRRSVSAIRVRRR